MNGAPRHDPGPPDGPRSPRVLSLPERAETDLRLIRETMARSHRFTRLSGRTVVGLGVLALVGHEVARRIGTPVAWWSTWFAVGALGFTGGILGLETKARAVGQSLRSGSGRRFALGLLPPLAAAAVLTVALVRGGAESLVPGAWLLLYGVGLVTGGVTSVPVVRVLGGAFVLLGCVALVAPGHGHLLLAVGFGGLHLGFGAWIWGRYGG